jgi:hypothetical protein
LLLLPALNYKLRGWGRLKGHKPYITVREYRSSCSKVQNDRRSYENAEMLPEEHGYVIKLICFTCGRKATKSTSLEFSEMWGDAGKKLFKESWQQCILYTSGNTVIRFHLQDIKNAER